MSLDQLVNINISLTTAALPQEGFGTMIFVSKHKQFNDRVRYYSDLIGVSDDFDSSTNEYKAAQAAFMQSPAPSLFGIGRVQLSTASITASVASGGAVTGTTYSFLVQDGVADGSGNYPVIPISYTVPVGSPQTAPEVAAALESAFTAAVHTGLVSSVSGGSAILDINDSTTSGAQLGRVFSVYGLTPNLSLSLATYGSLHGGSGSTETGAYADAISSIFSNDKTWYAVAINSRAKADILAVAEFVETIERIFYTADNADNNYVTPSDPTTDPSILGSLKNLNLFWTTFMYHLDATVAGAPKLFPEIAYFAKIAPKVPGSYTADLKTLSGFVAYALDDTVSMGIRNKNGNTYEMMGGVACTFDGKVVGGEWIDTVILRDWTKSNMQQNLFYLMKNSDKLPFSDAGIQAAVGEMKKVLDQGTRNGGYSSDMPYTITAPRARDFTSAQRASRRLTDLKFNATTAGAIQAVEINGNVTA